MRRAIRLQRAPQQNLNFSLGFTVILTAELHANTAGSVALRTTWRYPYDLAGDRDSFGFLHQRQQQKYLFAKLEFFIGGDEQAAVLYKRDIGSIERALILNCQ